MLILVLFFILFFALQALVLFCCLAAGDDPLSQAISDQEQLDYIHSWMEKHKPT